MQRYSVPEMTCGHCAQTIEKAVKRADPQADVTVDLSTRKVTVRSDIEEGRIAEAIRSAGYENQRIP